MIENQDIFGLVGVNTTSLQASTPTGGRRGGFAPYSPWQNWADKDVEGNSSIARSNRATRDEQKLKEGKDLYEDYLQDTYGDDWKDVAPLFGDSLWDDLSEQQQKGVATQLGAGMSSIEQSRIRQGMEDVAEDKIREDKRERESQRREDKHDEMFGGWRPPENQTPQPGDDAASSESQNREEDYTNEDLPIEEQDRQHGDPTKKAGGSGDQPVTQAELQSFINAYNSHTHPNDGTTSVPYG